MYSIQRPHLRSLVFVFVLHTATIPFSFHLLFTIRIIPAVNHHIHSKLVGYFRRKLLFCYVWLSGVKKKAREMFKNKSWVIVCTFVWCKYRFVTFCCGVVIGVFCLWLCYQRTTLSPLSMGKCHRHFAAKTGWEYNIQSGVKFKSCSSYLLLRRWCWSNFLVFLLLSGQ